MSTASVPHLSVMLAALLLLPTFSRAQSRNLTVLPVTTIPSGLTAQCPNTAQIQGTLNDIRSAVQDIVQELFPPPPPCGDPSVWRQVILINMSDPTQDCPLGLVFTMYDNIRTCGRQEDVPCSAITFNVPGGGEYSQVCGRIRGYQWGETNGFYDAIELMRDTIDEQYLNGVSLTHGDEGNREHIWSFASGRSQTFSEQSFHSSFLCPCDVPDSEMGNILPDFIADDYFCESGALDYPEDMHADIFLDNPLWDGQGCRAESRCCGFNSPPWFTKELPGPTSDPIEFRLCLGSFSKEVDLPVDLIELYVQ